MEFTPEVQTVIDKWRRKIAKGEPFVESEARREIIRAAGYKGGVGETDRGIRSIRGSGGKNNPNKKVLTVGGLEYHSVKGKMGSKVAIGVILGLGVGGLALFLLTREAKEAPPPPPPTTEIPTADNIMGAKSTQELDAYYNLIGELYIIGKISTEDYMMLYDVYQARFYELIGGAT